MEFNGLEDLLYEDWTWRKTEISDLILLAELEGKNVLLKSTILLLYAHWEGYIKKSSKTYLKFITDNRIKISDLTDNFKYVALKGLSREVFSSSSTLNLNNELKFIEKSNKINFLTFDKLLSIDLENEREKTIVDTQDNLTPEIFKKIIEIIGLAYLDGYELKRMHIEHKLVAHRNSIGHGNRRISIHEEFQLEIVELKELKDIVFSIIESFRDDILKYAKEQYYLREKSDQIVSYILGKETRLQQEFNEIQSRYTYD